MANLTNKSSTTLSSLGPLNVNDVLTNPWGGNSPKKNQTLPEILAILEFVPPPKWHPSIAQPSFSSSRTSNGNDPKNDRWFQPRDSVPPILLEVDMILPWRVLCTHVTRRPTICKIFASVMEKNRWFLGINQENATFCSWMHFPSFSFIMVYIWGLF